jgi:hypothetical protein
MTKLLEKALEAVRRLPPRSQDEIAQAMLTLAGDEGEPEAIDRRICPPYWKALLRRNADSSPPMTRSKPRFAASINEAPIYAACGTRYRCHRGLYSRA